MTWLLLARNRDSCYFREKKVYWSDIRNNSKKQKTKLQKGQKSRAWLLSWLFCSSLNICSSGQFSSLLVSYLNFLIISIPSWLDIHCTRLKIFHDLLAPGSSYSPIYASGDPTIFQSSVQIKILLFLAAPWGIRVLSSPTSDQTREPGAPAVRELNPNQWTTREFPNQDSLDLPIRTEE